MKRKFSKNRRSLKAVLSVFMAFAMSAGLAFATACDKDDGGDHKTDISGDAYEPVETDKPSNSDTPVILPSESEDSYTVNEYKATTAVGFYGKVTGTVERNRPVDGVHNEGSIEESKYPKFGYTPKGVTGSGNESIRDALIAESSYLTATGTRNAGGGGYTWMDEDGYLYSGTRAEPVSVISKYTGLRRQLYKHVCGVENYFGEVDDDEPGIVKEVTIRPRGYNSYSVTGVYAPAGEVIKIEISKADMEATKGLTIHIGQALYNGQANNIWTAKNQMPRIPHLLNTMVVTKDTAEYDEAREIYTAYVGSFIGGPLYIRNAGANFTATISGGVRYSHFILGYTTEEEFEEDRKSSAPYFDMEVWNYGVLHSGPKNMSTSYSYEDLYKAAVLWEKVSSVTTTGSSQGIVFLYEPFVAAGAAVAFPGRSSVNCPTGWMRNSLNYNGMVTSGAWGNFHEYHHNFQGYGVGNGGEVTNNGMTLVSYALFTKISSHRSIGSYGAAGLSGWNRYTSASWALNDVLQISAGGSPSNGKQGLSLYATLLHNFGANNYIGAKVAGGGQSYAAYMNAWQKVTHNNMYYYFNDVLQGTGIENNADPSYPMFVPVSSVYQTGRSFMYDGEKKYFKTMQPYVISYGQDFNIDLGRYSAPNGLYESGSIVIPDGFDYTVRSVSKPKYGTVEVVDGYNIKYVPDKEHMESGEIKVTLEIRKKDNKFKVDDVDLILEFEQSHETNKLTLERTTYTYTEETMYTDAVTAYENDFENYTSVTEKVDHSNPVQNCNTDIWFYPDNDASHQKYPDAPDSHFVHNNTIEVLEGKLYFTDAGTYRIFLRGRTNCAVYYSVDGGKTYKLGAKIDSLYKDSSNFHPNDEKTYFDVTIGEEQDSNHWIHFKEVLLVQSTPAVSFIGLGYQQWTQTMFTIAEKHYNADNTEVESTESDGYEYTETTYNDYGGRAVAVVVKHKNGVSQYYKIVNNKREPSTQEEVSVLTESKIIPPTKASYANAYRSTYEFKSNNSFETDYFYTRKYTYSYNGDEQFVTAKQTLTDSVYRPWDNTPTYSINNLFDGNDKTFIHSNRTAISESNPFSVTVRLDSEVTANRLTFHGSAVSSNYATYLPKNFKIWVSKDGNDWTLVADKTNAPASNLKTIAEFDGFHTFSYYKTEVTATHARNNLGYIALNKIELSSLLSIKGGNAFSPDNDIFAFNDKWNSVQAFSTFGHVYSGSNGAEMKFRFNGTRLALMSVFELGTNFEVYIDGNKMNSIELKKFSNSYNFSYISDELAKGTHSVVIKCTDKADIASVIVYE